MDHYQNLYAFAMHLSTNEADAKDLTQHTFYKLAERVDKMHDFSRIKSWLYSTLYRRFIDIRRKDKRITWVDPQQTDAQQTAEEAVSHSSIDHQTALQHLMSLDEHLRAPLSLYYLEGYSYKEIAQNLELPIGTVMSRLHRAKTALYQKLSKGEGDTAS